VSLPAPATGNRYTVREVTGEQGWEVLILDPGGAVAWSRPCASQNEARTFASTVRQHVYWLSEDKFREYYRLEPPA
jgi:hypothetical protein